MSDENWHHESEAFGIAIARDIRENLARMASHDKHLCPACVTRGIITSMVAQTYYSALTNIGKDTAEDIICDIVSDAVEACRRAAKVEGLDKAQKDAEKFIASVLDSAKKGGGK